jgi:hypothetical protein
MIWPTLLQLIKAGVTGDALVTAIREIEEGSVPKRSSAAERQAQYRERKARDVTLRNVTSRDVTNVTIPPSKKESKNQETGKEPVSCDGPTQAELEKAYYARGRQVCGKQSGGLLTALLKAKEYQVPLARAVIETASTKHDPREYVAAASRSKANDPKSAIAAADRLIDKLGGMEAAQAYVPGSSGPTPLSLDFGEISPSPKLISSR